MDCPWFSPATSVAKLNVRIAFGCLCHSVMHNFIELLQGCYFVFPRKGV